MGKNRSIWIRNISGLVFSVLFIMLFSTGSFAESSEDKKINGNYGVDVYVFYAWNNGMTLEDHLYLPGLIYRNTVRGLGWPSLYLSDDMDIYLDPSGLTIVVYYNSSGHAALCIMTGDIVL